MPKLIRVYITQCLIGFAISAVFAALLLGLDIAGLRGLVLGTKGGWIALFMLWFFNGLVFAGVQFGITIMALGRPEGPAGGIGAALAPLARWARGGAGVIPAAIPVREGERAGKVAGPQQP